MLGRDLLGRRRPYMGAAFQAAGGAVVNSVSLTDVAALADAPVLLRATRLEDSGNFADAAVLARTLSVLDLSPVADSASPVASWLRQATDAAGLTDTASRTLLLRIEDLLALLDTTQATAVAGGLLTRSLTDVLALLDATTLLRGLTLGDASALTDAPLVTLSATAAPEPMPPPSRPLPARRGGGGYWPVRAPRPPRVDDEEVEELILAGIL